MILFFIHQNNYVPDKLIHESVTNHKYTGSLTLSQMKFISNKLLVKINTLLNYI